ncbi:type VI secretion system contractile sheath small subunit [Limnoglobus roseus]|uniref:Type VI secretion system contractile sheath small subunit n=1 Tax=Limnoglobus roseus TaxID=2598579 RepID=A0A5C1ARC0_9BACT|nr:type VI secretion system contractile sheath small subunit [Limnoglobus roseus]QEL19744.1 type VI secretion system contractile sheath small subunit [Limnoglobus roseus]
MAESFQHKLDRVRSPRVQITYDVETNGAMVKRELPFVVGIMAGLSGHRDEKELGALKDRKFVEIDRDNVDSVMKDAAPMLNLSVANKLTDDGTKLRTQIQFRSMDDFEPAKVAEQVAPLKELLEMRKRLDEVLSRISTNSQLESVLQDVLANTEKVQELAKQMGIDANTGEAK